MRSATAALAAGSGFIAIYANASGLPIKYTAPNIYYYDSCVYDDRGNLYTDGKNSRMGTGLFLRRASQGKLRLNNDFHRSNERRRVFAGVGQASTLQPKSLRAR